MSLVTPIHLNTSCILNVPLQNYDKDFSFYVNSEEFKTSHLIAELLSPTICKARSKDPSFNTFTINTQYRGDFSNILKLVNFHLNDLPSNEIPFLTEVIESLGNDCIELEETNNPAEITLNNVLNLLLLHEKFQNFYRRQFSEEINFASSHFYELCEGHDEEFSKLSPDTLMLILKNDSLQLISEDEFLKFANRMYSIDPKFVVVYEEVQFARVSSNVMKQFNAVFDAKDMTKGVLDALSKRLEQDVVQYPQLNENRNVINQQQAPNDDLGDIVVWNGIFNRLRRMAGGQIENLVHFTSSSIYNNDDKYRLQNVVLFDESDKFFCSMNKNNSWICFDLKDHRAVLTHYTIKSVKMPVNGKHPRSWVIEGSNDNMMWSTISDEKDCPYLNGQSLVHTFKVNGNCTTEFRYIRMRLTCLNWNNNDYLKIESFEIYGRLI